MVLNSHTQKRTFVHFRFVWPRLWCWTGLDLISCTSNKTILILSTAKRGIHHIYRTIWNTCRQLHLHNLHMLKPFGKQWGRKLETYIPMSQFVKLDQGTPLISQLHDCVEKHMDVGYVTVPAYHCILAQSVTIHVQSQEYFLTLCKCLFFLYTIPLSG